MKPWPLQQVHGRSIKEPGVNLADTPWMIVLIAFLLGGGAGALIYHLLNSSVARNLKVRQKLTETELQLTQTREGVNDHFARTADGLSILARQIEELEQSLQQDASRLCDDDTVLKRLEHRRATHDDNVAPSTNYYEPPKDYSEGTSGTLSEDFGFSHQDVKEPPRTGA